MPNIPKLIVARLYGAPSRHILLIQDLWDTVLISQMMRGRCRRILTIFLKLELSQNADGSNNDYGLLGLPSEVTVL